MKSRLTYIFAVLAIVFSLINPVNPAAASGLLEEIKGLKLASSLQAESLQFRV